MNKEFVGNIGVEFLEIEKLNQPKQDSVGLEQITEASGGFLTWICC